MLRALISFTPITRRMTRRTGEERDCTLAATSSQRVAFQRQSDAARPGPPRFHSFASTRYDFESLAFRARCLIKLFLNSPPIPAMPPLNFALGNSRRDLCADPIDFSRREIPAVCSAFASNYWVSRLRRTSHRSRFPRQGAPYISQQVLSPTVVAYGAPESHVV